MGDGWIPICVIGVIGIIVATIYRMVMRHCTAEEIEAAIADGSREKVRALIIAKAHWLRKSVRDDAKVWLLEQDNAAEKKR